MGKLAGWTDAEEAAVLAVWSKILEALPGAGAELLINWFKAHPGAQAKFAHFAGKSEADLRNSPRLKAHAVKILSNLNVLIIARNDPDVVAELLNDLKRDHTKRQVSKDDHMKLAAATLELANGHFPGLCNDAAKSGLTKLMNLTVEYTVPNELD
jgi:hypothetical protein